MKNLLGSIILVVFFSSCVAQQQQWVRYNGAEGVGKGKHIVLVSGDEEYRSEEALPMLAQILSKKYGFTCTVLFALDQGTENINPVNQQNIPGLEQLASADLMLIFARFRELPDSQMKYIDEYLKAGKPVVGLRTATHSFNYSRNKNSAYAKYDFQSTVKGWEDGFGRVVLGETWINHHGVHGSEGTRALINGVQQDAKNPILNGVADIWCPTDVYTVRELSPGSQVLVYGQSTSGMNASAPVNLKKSVMPVAWTRSYSVDAGKTGRVFATTMGAAVDLVNEDLRRLVINAVLWASGLEDKIPAKADVGTIGEYKPTMFGFGTHQKGLKVSTYTSK
jgi:type 1 glutamine amidotransferase